MIYLFITIAVIIGSLSLSTYVQTERLDACKVERKELELNIEAAKNVAAKEKEAIEAQQVKHLGDTNAKYETKLSELNNTISKLRKQRSSANSSVVPEARTSNSSSVPSGQICFDREKFARAQSDSETEAEEIAIRGTTISTEYSCALNWADKNVTNIPSN